MKSLLVLSANDFRSTFRDPIFKGLLVFPFLSFAIVRGLLPVLIARFPIVEPYSNVILMWACLQSAIMFGFIYGFLFLEEKEENIWQVIRVLPISGLKLVSSRLLIGFLVSSMVNFCLLHWGRVVHFPLYQEIILSLQFSLAAPLIALVLGAFANNRIEGLAQMKIVNILLILPGLIYILPYSAFHFTAFIPTYWSFRSLEMAAESHSEFLLYFLFGTIFYLTCIFLLNRRLERSILS